MTEAPVGTTRSLLAWAAVAYLLSITLGFILRLHLVMPIPGVEYDHYLHAHSHTLYFGWVAVTVLALASQLIGASSRSTLRLGTGLLIGAGAMFLAFLQGGYGPLSIAVSTAVMFGWYWAALWWWRRARGLRSTSHSYLRAAFGYMVASTFGIWVLAYLQASETGTPLTEDLAIAAFLLGYSWFFIFSVLGLISGYGDLLGIHLDDAVLKRALRWAVPAAWITFPLGVVGGAETDILGFAARIAAVILLYPAWLWVRELWMTRKLVARTLAMWFAAATLLGAAAVPGLSTPAVAARQPVVMYLHILLLGFVTGALIAIGAAANRTPLTMWWVHHGGLAIMSLGLGMASLATMGAAAASLLMPGLWIAVAGGLIIYASAFPWVVQWWVARR